MTAGLEIHGKHILEPSAGSGNIVDFLTLEKTDVSHFDFIIMNPPFSTQNDHILHAWEIAPAGCQIVFSF